MNKTLKTTSLFVTSILAVAFFITPATVRAAETSSSAAAPTATSRQAALDQDIALLRVDVREKRRQIVAANLPLTTEESAKFWPIYDEYIAESTKIFDGRLERIRTYATNYTTMSEEMATEHVTKLLASDKAMIDLRGKYMSKFEKALAKKKVAMFVQLDRRVQMLMDIQIANQIPLIQPQ